MTGKHHVTLDEILADGWHEDRWWQSCWYGGRRRLRSAWAARRKPRWWWQRARRGYSTRDWWCFDTYISGVIAKACRDFQEHGRGYPGDMTAEEWEAILDGIATPLEAYIADVCDDTYEEQMAKYEAARVAMHLFAENLGGFWD
ncbi:hypothetical protein ACFWPU_00835 [Streptomyces sp. NPDC058471]|uniref:hypothetical protein n=1 Tax=Streptomyces sp. NPDC058471 TaxID=3346516 RepID=UPI003647C655